MKKMKVPQKITDLRDKIDIIAEEEKESRKFFNRFKSSTKNTSQF